MSSRNDPLDPRLLAALLEYEAACAEGKRPPARAFAAERPELTMLLRELALREFDWIWREGGEDIVEAHLNRYREFRDDDAFLLALLRVELSHSPSRPDAAKLAARFPRLKDDIALLLRANEQADQDHTRPPLLAASPEATVRTPHPDFRPPTDDPGALPEGTTLSVVDRYRILRLIGRGGEKYVYEAHQSNPGRVVALKTPIHPAGGAGMVLEGRVAAQLDHQKIPAIMNLSGDGEMAILAERHIDGKSWNKRLDEQRGKVAEAGPAERADLRQRFLRENLKYLQDVCDALAYAHGELRVIHRDLKPENVMLSRFNETLGRFTEVYVVDWGLALYVGDDSGSEVRARRRSSVYGFSGTRCYSAPEMWAGVGEDLGTATDVFLLGALLYELLTDTWLYIEKNIIRLELMARMAQFQPPEERAPDRAIPFELRQIALRALAAEPGDRYADASEFAQALEEYQRHAEAEQQIDRALARLAELKKRLAGGAEPAHALLSPLLEVAGQLRQASAGWETTGQAGPMDNEAYRRGVEGERGARRSLVELAEGTENFALAEAQLDHLAALPAPDREGVEAQRGRIRGKAAARRRQAWLLRGAAAAVALLAAGLAAAGFHLVVQRGEIREKALAQEQAEKLADETSRRLVVEQKLGKARQDNLEREEAARKDREMYAAMLPWRDKARDAVEGRFDQAAALSYAKAMTIHPDADLRLGWQEASQRALVPVQYSSRRLRIGCLAYSADGRHLVTGDVDGKGNLRVWEAGSGEEVRVLDGHPEPTAEPSGFSTVRKLVLDPAHPRRVWSAGQDGTIRLSDFTTGELVRSSASGATGPAVQLLGLDTTRDPVAGRHVLATGDDRGRLVLWDPETLRPLHVVDAKHKTGIGAVALHPGGEFCATGGRDGRVRFWDLQGKPLERQLPEAKRTAVNDLAISPDGKYLAVACDALDVEVWDLPARKRMKPLRATERVKRGGKDLDRVFRLAFAPDGELFATGADGTVRRWNLATGRAGSVILRHDADLGGTRTAIAVAIAPDGKEVATTGADMTLRRWDRASGRLLRTLEGHQASELFGCSAAAFDPATGTLVTGGGPTNAVLRSWDLSALREKKAYTQGYTFRYGDVSTLPAALAIDPGRNAFVAGLINGDLLMYQTAPEPPATFGTGTLGLLATAQGPLLAAAALIPSRTAPGGLRLTAAKAHVFPDHPLLASLPLKPAITALAWSRDGKRIVSAGYDNRLKLWDAASLAPLNAWNASDPERPRPRNQPFDMPPLAAAFDPDNVHVLTADFTGVVLRWNPKTGKIVQRFFAHTTPVTALAFSRDGKWLATGGTRDIVLWDWKTKQVARRIHLPPLTDSRRLQGMRARGNAMTAGTEQDLAGVVVSLAFSSDAGLLAATQTDGSVSVLDGITGAVLHRAVGHAPVVPPGGGSYCFFTEDGKLLTAGGDGLILKWDLATMLAGGKARPGPANRLAVSPDGREWAGVLAFNVIRWATPGKGGEPFALGHDRRLWISPFGTKDWPRPVGVKHADGASVVAYAPDGKSLIVGNFFGTAVVLDPKTAKVRATFHPPQEAKRGDTVPAITTIAADPSSAFVASNAQETLPTPLQIALGSKLKHISRVNIWRVADGKLHKALEWPGHRIATVAFRPGGTDLATVDEDGVTTVWDWRAGKKRWTEKGPAAAGIAGAMAYAPDGSHLVQAGLGGEAVVRDAGTGKERQRWIAHQASPVQPGAIAGGVAFRRDGTLATCGSDGAVRLWRRDKGAYRPLAVWLTMKLSSYRALGADGSSGRTHAPGLIRDLRFTPDGEHLVGWGIGTPAWVFHVPTGLAQQGTAPTDIVRLTGRLTGLDLRHGHPVPRDRNRLVRPGLGR